MNDDITSQSPGFDESKEETDIAKPMAQDNVVPLAAPSPASPASPALHEPPHGPEAEAEAEPQPALAPQDRHEQLRMLEALLFASREPISAGRLSERLPEGADIDGLLKDLQTAYAGRGVNVCVANGRWSFRTAEDLGFILQKDVVEERKLSRAALETLAIVAYHQPTTRAEIEEIRGVTTHKGTLDILLQTGWLKIRGRRKVPGRPVTYGTSDAFLDHFGLGAIGDLPGMEELKEAGLLESTVPVDFPLPHDTKSAPEGDEGASHETSREDEGDRQDGGPETLETQTQEAR